MIASDFAEHVVDGALDNWDQHGGYAVPWTWSIDEQIDFYLNEPGRDPSADISDTKDR